MRRTRTGKSVIHPNCWHLLEKADEDGHVYLVSYNDHFVSIDSHHAIHMVAEKDKTCKFTLVQDESTGMYEFKSAHGHYITIDDDNHVKTSHDQPKKEQKFRLEKFNHGHKHHDKVHHAVNK